MLTIFWGLGSMIVLLLIISILPIGFTFKGKFIITIASLIVGLGGVAAVSTFPLWQTSLMLLALIIFMAYFMDKRMGGFLYKTAVADGLEEEDELDEPTHLSDSEKENNVMDMVSEDVLPQASIINLKKVTPEELMEAPITAELNAAEESEMIDEDISFFMERELEVEETEQEKELGLEDSYLSDIESLLEAEEKIETIEENESEELSDLKTVTISNQIGEKMPDDSLFEFLLAAEEAAADQEDILEIIEPEKKVSLQK